MGDAAGGVREADLRAPFDRRVRLNARLAHRPASADLGQVLRFVVCSGSAAATNLACGSVLLALWRPGPVGYGGILALCYCIGMAVNFLLNRRYTFTARYRSIGREARTFLVVSLIGLGLTVVIGWIARGAMQGLAGALRLGSSERELWFANVAAQMLTIGVVAIYSFLGHRTFTFANGIRARLLR